MVGVGKRAQFFVVTMVVVAIALFLMLGYATIAREIKISSLQEVEAISRDISSLRIDSSEVEQRILKEWFDFKFSKRIAFKVINDGNKRNLWIFSTSVFFPKEIDYNSIRIVDSENFEIPSQVYVENESLGEAEIVFLDSLEPFEEKDYMIYFKYKDEEPRIGKAKYKPMVVISENANEFVIDSLSYIVHIPKNKGGAITDLYVKDYLNNSIYKQTGFNFQSEVETTTGVFTQENCQNANFEILENGPYLAILKISCSHKDQSGSSISGENFTQYQYYYPTYFIVREQTNFGTQINGNYTYSFFLNSTTFQNYRDSLDNSLSSSLQDLGSLEWLDFYKNDFGVGVKILASQMSIKGRNATNYYEIRLEDSGSLRGNFEKKFIIYPHLGNFSETMKFSELYSHKPNFIFRRVEKVDDVIDKISKEVFSTLIEKGYSIFINFTPKNGFEDFSSQPDWIGPSFRHRIVLNLISKGEVLEPVKLKFNGTVNLNSIKVVDSNGMEVGYQISQEVTSPASFEEKFRCESGATNEFYLLNLDGRDFFLDITGEGQGAVVQICIYYPNLSGFCVSPSWQQQQQKLFNDTIPGMRGIYKVVVNINVPGVAWGVQRGIMISTTLPKMVVSGNSIYLDSSTPAGELFFHVPENKESFSIGFFYEGGNPDCNLSILDEDKNLLKEEIGVHEINLSIENMEGGSFYYLRYSCIIPAAKKAFYINFTNVSKSIGNDKEHWFDFENPEFYFFFSKEFKKGKLNRLFIYYNNVSECFGSYDNPQDLGCPKTKEEVSTDLLLLPNLTIANSHYKISFQDYFFSRILKGYWLDKSWKFRRKITIEENEGVAKEGAVRIEGITIDVGKVKNCSKEVRVTAPPGFWNYRRKIIVKEIAGVEEENISLTFLVPHNNHAQSNCNDVYLFDESLKLIQYEITLCNSTHVKLKFLLNLSANSTEQFYVYYGNTRADIPIQRSTNLQGNLPVGVNISIGEEETNPPQSFDEVEIPRKVESEVYSGGYCINFTLLFNTSLQSNQMKTYYLYYGNEIAEQLNEATFGTTLSGIVMNVSEEENLTSENWFVTDGDKVSTLNYVLDPTLVGGGEYINFSSISLVDNGSLRKIVGMEAGPINYSAEFYAWKPVIRIKVFGGLERSAVRSTWNLRTDGSDDFLAYIGNEQRALPLNQSFKDLTFREGIMTSWKGDYNSLLGISIAVDSIVPSNDFLSANESSISIKLRNDGEFYFIISSGNTQEFQELASSIGKLRYIISSYQIYLKFVKKGQVLVVS